MKYSYLKNMNWSMLRTAALQRLLAIVLVSSSMPIYAQTCYITKIDASGINTNNFQSALNAKACELINTFPEPFKSQFKVYDFGFYTQHEVTQGYPEPFNQQLLNVQSESPYYLLFGKQSDSKGLYTKIWVDVKLPSTDQFRCIDLISPTLRDDITRKVTQEVTSSYSKNGNNFFKYHDAEIAGMEALKKLVLKQLDCCAPQKGSATCDACLESEDPVAFMQKCVDLGFFFFPVIIHNDPDFDGLGSSLPQGPNGHINAEIKFAPSGVACDIDSLVKISFDLEKNDLFERIPDFDTTTTIFSAKFPHDCGVFASRWKDFQTSSTGLNVFVCLINIDNEVGFIGMKINRSKPSARAEDNPGLELRTTELNLLHEDIGVDENSCFNLAFAKMKYASQYYIPQLASSLVKGKPKAEAAYRTQKERYLELVEEAEYNYSLAWEREYTTILKKNGLSAVNLNDSKAWDYYYYSWITSYHICDDAIHTILDLCGAIEGVGTLCDGTNAVLYLVEGKLADAGMSSLSVLPVVGAGIAATKYGRKIISSFPNISECLKKSSNKSVGPKLDVCHLCTFYRRGDGFFSWGYKKINSKTQALQTYLSQQYQFRLYMNNHGAGGNAFEVIANGRSYKYVDGTTEAHHIIPWEIHGINVENKRKGILEQAAYAGWHPNDPKINGIPLPKDLHRADNANHPKYTEYVSRILDKKTEKLVEELKEDLLSDPAFFNSFIEKNGAADYQNMIPDDLVKYLDPQKSYNAVLEAVEEMKIVIDKIRANNSNLNEFKF